MAEYFRSKGVRAEAVHSQIEDDRFRREKIVEEFKERKISVLFAVDIFNEGVDIPEIDTVMFLRPTESYVVFLQQLGRGLRKHQNKTKLTVIDFIGNYKRAHYKPLLLAGKNPMVAERITVEPDNLKYPEGCQVTFDLRVIDLFREMRKRDPLIERMKDEYFRLKNELGNRPSRENIYEGSDIDHREFMKEGYLKYLYALRELTEVEEGWSGTDIERFLSKLEKTAMSRSYKLPVLLALIEGKGTVSYDDLGETFMEFYKVSKRRSMDLELSNGNEKWKSWNKESYLEKALSMPVRVLSDKLIMNDKKNKTIRFPDYILEAWNEDLKVHLLDILSMREKVYYSRSYLER